MGKAGKADICDCLVNKRAMKGFGSVQIGTKRQRNGRVQSYYFVAFLKSVNIRDNDVSDL